MPTITSTPAPTLTANERQALVQKMLQDNGGCELPCWWGITPGKTDWNTLRDRFIAFGGTVFDIIGANHLRSYSISHTFVNRSGIVESIQVMGETAGGVPSDRFAQDWQRYSLDRLLMRYGVPSEVQLSLLPATEPGSFPGYRLTIAYDNLGFFVYYAGSATMVATKTLACPIWRQVNFIELQMQAPQPGISVVQSISPENKPFVHALEDATGMGLDEFYQTFKNANSRACLNLPTGWPQ